MVNGRDNTGVKLVVVTMGFQGLERASEESWEDKGCYGGCCRSNTDCTEEFKKFRIRPCGFEWKGGHRGGAAESGNQ